MANTRGDDPNQHFAFFGRFNVNFYNFQWLVWRERHGGTGFDHKDTPSEDGCSGE
jgi:hypothetical protein